MKCLVPDFVPDLYRILPAGTLNIPTPVMVVHPQEPLSCQGVGWVMLAEAADSLQAVTVLLLPPGFTSASRCRSYALSYAHALLQVTLEWPNRSC